MFKKRFIKIFSVSLLVASPLSWAAGANGWVSVSATEVGNALSEYPSISADGHFIVFASDADNLVPGDTNGATDVFWSDWYTGETRRISVNSGGKQGNAASREPIISADGRFVVFVSVATNLVAGDKNGKDDIFVHDLETGKTRRVSVNSKGKEANDNSFTPSISANGRYVAFASWADNLVNNDPNVATDIFVHDLVTGKTGRGSVDQNGGVLPWIAVHSQNPTLSADGRYVVYESDPRDVTCTVNCKVTTIYRYDRNTGKAVQVDVNTAGQPGNFYSLEPTISGNGRYVAFLSYANDLVAGDNNKTTDVFVRDMNKGSTERVSVNSKGQETANQQFGSMIGPFGKPGISFDGRYVSFDYDADNLAAGISGYQIYLRDRIAGKTQWVSRTNSGDYPDNYSYGLRSDVSVDGRHIAFESRAANLVFAGPDINGVTDVYARDQRILLSKPADLQVTQSGNVDPVKPGQTVTYRMVVKNLGKIAAANARLVAIPELPKDARITKVGTNKGSCQKGAVTVCKLGKMAAGSSAVVSLQVKLKPLPTGKLPQGELVNRVSVYTDPYDPDLSNNRRVEKTAVVAN